MATEFKSQICTTVEQSDRLLGLGLKKETADMCQRTTTLNGEAITYPSQDVWKNGSIITKNHFPAWSLGRLLALVNGEDWRAEITLKDERYGIHYGYNTDWYDDIFEAAIAWIEDDIKEGYFNKEYLV